MENVDRDANSAIAALLKPHTKDLGGFEVQRLLPSGAAQMVGPFIFFDHFGPAIFPPGDGVAVRPHPHIGLATVTDRALLMLGKKLERRACLRR